MGWRCLTPSGYSYHRLLSLSNWLKQGNPRLFICKTFGTSSRVDTSASRRLSSMRSTKKSSSVTNCQTSKPTLMFKQWAKTVTALARYNAICTTSLTGQRDSARTSAAKMRKVLILALQPLLVYATMATTEFLRRCLLRPLLKHMMASPLYFKTTKTKRVSKSLAMIMMMLTTKIKSWACSKCGSFLWLLEESSF